MSDTRRERSRMLCRILSKHVAREAPEGLGQWGPAWELVEAPSRRFLEALDEWERTGEEPAMDRAKALALGVRDAWREAARKHEEAGAREGVPA